MKPPRRTLGGPRAGRRAWGRVLAWGLTALALLCAVLAVVWWAAPEQLRQQVERRGTEALGRPVRLQQLQLSLMPLRLTLQGLVIEAAAPPAAGAPPAPALLQVQRLELEIEPWSLWRGEPVVTKLQVDAPRVHLARSAAGAWSVDDLGQRFRPAGVGAPGAGTAPVFTLQAVALQGGGLTLEDGLHQQRHEAADLKLDLPWFSTRPADAERTVQPRLSMRLNGAAVSLQAQGLPLRPQPSGQARLEVTDLALEPFWSWLPPQLALRPRQGRLDAALAVAVEQAPGGQWSLALSGSSALKTLEWVNAAGAPMAAWQRLELSLQDVRPLQRIVHLAGVRLEGAEVHVRRDGRGQLEWAALGAAASPGAATAPSTRGTAPAAPPVASSAAPPSTRSAPLQAAVAPAPPPTPQAPGWDVRTGPVAVTGLQVHWLDQTMQPALRARVSPVDLRFDGLSWPVRQASAFELAAQVQPPVQAGGRRRADVALALQGTVSDRAAQVAWRVGPLALQAWQPYLGSVLRPALRGTAHAAGEVEWAAGPTLRLRLAVSSGRVDDFQAQFPGAQAAPLSWRSLSVQGLRADLLTRRLEVEQIAWRDPALALRRDRDGLIGLLGAGALEVLFVPRSGPPARPSPASAPAQTADRAGRAQAAPPDAPWRLSVARLRVAGGRVDAVDELVPSDIDPAAPWTLRLQPVSLEVDRLSWPPAAAPAQLRLALQWPQQAAAMGDETPAPATVNLAGQLRLDTPGFEGAVQMERWPLQRFEPQWAYLGLALPLRLARAELGLDARGGLRLGPQGLESAGEGSVRVADVRVMAPAAAGPAAAAAVPVASPADELATWNLLELQGLRWQVQPGRQPRVELTLARLSDFFARLQVTEAGRLNLQDVTAPRPGAAMPPAAPAAPAPVVQPGARPAAASPDPQAGSAAADASAPGAVPAAGPSRWPLDLRVERTELVNGRVDFIDRFIRPNYAADLTELNGYLGRFESGSAAMAPVELRGRAARTALLEIRGAVNPLASPLMLDLSARATDLELAPLSPYGAKYVGYAIERGKLSVDLSYRIEADGRLEARNQIILNQLTFGERIDSPYATSLPVRLALALLADRNGVIDVNLPVSGSINDPQFSLTGLVFRMIGNFLVKVVTAPFSWLAGSDTRDLSLIGFEPGAARLEIEAGQTLDRVSRALADRPSLRMTITGVADPESESPALRQAALNERLAAVLRREAARAGTAPQGPAPLPARDSAAYAALIQRLYDETALPGKPRNLLGVPTQLPVPQMEAMLLAHGAVNENSARELALQRALAVRDALIARGLAAERLFLAAPQVGPGADGAAKPQARMTLTGP